MRSSVRSGILPAGRRMPTSRFLTKEMGPNVANDEGFESPRPCALSVELFGALGRALARRPFVASPLVGLGVRGNIGVMRLFQDRHDAGQVLAERLVEYAGQPNVVVLALPRGGV